MSECKHASFKYGRCVRCRMTWEEQAKVAEAREFRFEVGQRVQTCAYSGVVRHRYLSMMGWPSYVVEVDAADVRGRSINTKEEDLSPAPLRRGDTVEREQADSIPAGTVVSDRHSRLWQRRPDDEGEDGFPWLRFGIEDGFSTEYLHWPVTVVEPAGDET